MEALTPAHLLLVAIAFVLLVGYRKLPDVARSVGRSMRVFRLEMRAPDDEGAAPTADELEREAAAAEARAAELRARAARPEGPPAGP